MKDPVFQVTLKNKNHPIILQIRKIQQNDYLPSRKRRIKKL